MLCHKYGVPTHGSLFTVVADISRSKSPDQSVLYFMDGAVYISHDIGFSEEMFDAMVKPGDRLRVLINRGSGIFDGFTWGFAVYREDEAVLSYEEVVKQCVHSRNRYLIFAAVAVAGTILHLWVVYRAERKCGYQTGDTKKTVVPRQ